jgi:hypothetical protein
MKADAGASNSRAADRDQSQSEGKGEKRGEKGQPGNLSEISELDFLERGINDLRNIFGIKCSAGC